jgi:hypothetical protein
MIKIMHWNYNKCWAILVFEDIVVTGARSFSTFIDQLIPSLIAYWHEMRQELKLMANYNHIKILKQGVTIWNKWRKDHPEITPDLSKTNLRSAGCLNMADLSGANLREVDLGRTYMFGILLTNADLFRANLTDADLSRVNLEGADLTDADLSRADLEGANLSNACLTGANLSKANLAEAKITVELSNAQSIEGTNLPDRLPYPASRYSTYWERKIRVVDECMKS